MAAVEFLDVSQSYGQQAILKKLNLAIHSGEFLVIVGPSGCGKSTLLRLTAGLDELSSGQILLNKKCINHVPPAQRNMAMVFQNYALYPHMTVYDNIAYSLKLAKLADKEIKTRVHHAAELLKISHLLQRKPTQLSGGQRQRVGMGRAMARSPAVFLFDEPLSNLDTQLRADMRHEIKKIHQTLNTTAIYVTHDHVEAMTLASRIVIMNQGRIEQADKPEVLYHQPANRFVAEFIGHYRMNFVEGFIDKTQNKILNPEAQFSLPLPDVLSRTSCGSRVMVGIRPEHVRIVSSQDPYAIPVRLTHLDDHGADKLLYLNTRYGHMPILARVYSEDILDYDKLYIHLPLDRASIFDEKTGVRLGGWG